MPMPDPQTLVGKTCSIILRDGTLVVRQVIGVDNLGLKIAEHGKTVIYTYAEIAKVST